MKISPNSTCLCRSSKKYKKCCKPFHDGILPRFAVELMRSRFCAFALNKADYIISTTHSSNHDFSNDTEAWRNDILSFSTNTDFRNLEIIEEINEDSEAYVSFQATLFQDENDISFNEKSRFLKEENKWLYVEGTFFE